MCFSRLLINVVKIRQYDDVGFLIETSAFENKQQTHFTFVEGNDTNRSTNAKLVSVIKTTASKKCTKISFLHDSNETFTVLRVKCRLYGVPISMYHLVRNANYEVLKKSALCVKT